MQKEMKPYRWWSVGAILFALCVIAGMWMTRQPARAQELNPCFFSTGPMGLIRGQTSRHIFYLPAIQRDELSVDCRLMLMDTAGNTLVDTTFSLAPGSNFRGDLTVLADGSVRFNDIQLPVRVAERHRLEIEPCFFVGNMQKGVPVVATAQCAPNLNNSHGRNPNEPGANDPPEQIRLGATTSILQYHEYDSSMMGM
jgi:hypothetical protein